MTELINEMFNLKTAKGYEFSLASPDEYSAMPTVKFQATFVADSGVEYAFRAYTAKHYGKHTRILSFMRKKSKNYSQNITVDKGTFKKVLVTFMRCYEAYKSTKDGQKNSSFAVILQNSLKDYASLFVRATSRIFRTQKKVKLDLYAVNENGKAGSIELMYVNPSSIYPYFGGKGFDSLEFSGNETHVKLADIEGKSVDPAEQPSVVVATAPIQSPKKLNYQAGDYVVYVNSHGDKFSPNGFSQSGSVGKIKDIYYSENGDVNFVLFPYIMKDVLIHPMPFTKTDVFKSDEVIEKVIAKISQGDYYTILGDDLMTDDIWIEIAVNMGKAAKNDSSILLFGDDNQALQILNYYWFKDQYTFKKNWNIGFEGGEDGVIVNNSEFVKGDYFRVLQHGFPNLPIGSIGYVENVIGNVLTLRLVREGESGSINSTRVDISVLSFKEHCEVISNTIYDEQMKFMKGEIKGLFLLFAYKAPNPIKMIITDVTSHYDPLKFTSKDQNGVVSEEYYHNYAQFWVKNKIIEPFNFSMSNNKIVEPTQTPVDVPDVVSTPVKSTKIETQYIKMLNPSGSSKLKASEIATVVGVWDNADETLLDDLDIKSKNLLGKPVMVVVTSSGHNIALPVFDNVKDNLLYTVISSGEYADSKGIVNQSDFNKGNPPVKRDDAPIAPISTYDNLLSKLKPIQVGPISLDFNGVSIIDISEKLDEISEHFGSIDKTMALKIAKTANEKLASYANSISTKVDKELKKLGLQFTNDNAPTLQYNSLRHYTGSGYDEINLRLRGKTNSDYKDEDISNIDDAFSSFGVKLPADFRVYRGASITTEEIESLNNGKAYEMTGYTSTSLGTHTAYTFTKMGTANNANFAAAGTTGDLVGAYVPSQQGNKILFDIDRLDRCLGLYVAEISNYQAEYEYILNRGTFVKNRSKHKVTRVAKDPSNPEKGYWFAKVSVSGAGTEIFENAPKRFKEIYMMMNESLSSVKQTLDNIAVTEFYLNGVIEHLDETTKK